MKTVFRMFMGGMVLCSAVGVVIGQIVPTDPEDIANTMELIDDGQTIIEEGSEGLTTLAELYGAENYEGQTCTGPNTNCASGPSPDCDTGDCNAITTITIPTCEDNTSWLGSWYCYQNGMECENGTCPDGFMCYNSVDGGCTTDWWWF